MNAEYIKRALCFHGQPMQKIWETERGQNDLQELGVPPQQTYEIYQERQRYFTFQDRAKRLKLHQFFAKKANDLYDNELAKYANVADESHLEKVKQYHAILPPYELFAHKPNDKKPRRWQTILESINPGDVVYCIVIKATKDLQISVKPLCTGEPLVRYLNHLPIKATILPYAIGPMPLEVDESIRAYRVNDFVCCEVLRILADVDRMYLGMAGEPKNSKIKYGLVTKDALPPYYSKANECATQRYEECLKNSKEILNPNYDVLFSINGLDVNDNFTLMRSLKRPFPEKELAKNLRTAQAGKWAFRSVADGIERFKQGQHMEAFQCLNKALSIDPSNVEGLVARGALYANRGSFQKAVDDFKTALKVNKYHGNARKYLGETLIALGRSLEDQNRFEDAGKAYMDCLDIIPQHSQAIECLEKLNQQTCGNGGAGLLDDELLHHLINLTGEKSSSSSEESDDSDDSNSDTEEISKNPFKDEKEASLSPLSKRMALHAASLQAAAAPRPLSTAAIQYDQPFYYNLAQPTTSAPPPPNAGNDFRLEDDDTATRVRKLLEEASQHKKSKKKKKQKKNKKSKKNIESDKMEINDLAGSLFQNNYLQEAFKTVGSSDIRHKLNADISSYEQKIEEIKNRQARLRNSLSGGTAAPDLKSRNIDDNDSPPPPPPPMTLSKSDSIHGKTTTISFASKKESSSKRRRSRERKLSSSTSSKVSSTATAATMADAQKLSFQIRRPVKTDIFGMVRIATPLAQRSRSRTRSPIKRRDRRKSRFRSRSRSRSRGSDRHRRRSSSRSRSGSRHRYRRRDRSYSRSRSRTRSRSRPRFRRRTRSRSKSSNSRSRPSRHDHRRRHTKSKSITKSKSKSPLNSQKSVYGNRIWQRPGYQQQQAPLIGFGATGPSGSGGGLRELGNGRWQHDKFELHDPPVATAGAAALKPNNIDEDGPTIEEIDEIINKAQKERKLEIIKRDKDILKKPFKGRF